MTSPQAVHLYQSQERLERAGWRFEVRYLPNVDKWSVIPCAPWRSVHGFIRADRADALAQALQWATNEEELRHVA